MNPNDTSELLQDYERDGVVVIREFLTPEDAALIRQNGFQTPITWNGKSESAGLPERIRIHVIFEGKRNTDIRFSALYMKVVD